MTERILEVVATSVVDARAAVAGGADRLELAGCHTTAGALSPGVGLMMAARRIAPNLPIFAMVRPRYGAFIYDDEEVLQMEHDIDSARASGMDGVIFGAVTPDHELDVPALQRLFGAAEGLEVCINMAFDRCRDLAATLDWLIRDGRAARVLTAGGARTALEGADRISRLITQSAGRMGVLPGTAIDADSLPKLLDAVPEVDQVHVSAGARGSAEAFAAVDSHAVARLKRLLNRQ